MAIATADRGDGDAVKKIVRTAPSSSSIHRDPDEHDDTASTQLQRVGL